MKPHQTSKKRNPVTCTFFTLLTCFPPKICPTHQQVGPFLRVAGVVRGPSDLSSYKGFSSPE